MLEPSYLRDLNNIIKERHLDTTEIDAETFTVNDVAEYFTATTIEGVLAEIYLALNTLGIWDLTANEVTQLKNIDTTTISIPQWGYLGELDQSVKTTASPTFAGATLTDNLDMSDKNIVNVESVRLNITPTVASPVEGEMWWNSTQKTLNLKTHTDTIIQVGQEFHAKGKNKTADTIIDGSVVYQTGSENGVPTMKLANASSINTSRVPIGVCTVNVDVDDVAQVTLAGQVNGIDTDHLIAGAPCYISDTVDGGLTSTVPTHPSVRYLIGFCIVSDPTVGSIWVYQDNLDTENFYNGTFRESFNALLTSNGTDTITMSLERANGVGGGDLTMQFTSGPTVLDCTPALTIVLSNGTDTVPVSNYVYIPESTGVLTLSTTGFPTDVEHIKIGYFLVQSPAYVATDGALINQNWNDHRAGNDGQGHLSHVAERIRRQGALYFSGFDGFGVDDYVTTGVGTVYLKIESGVVYQMHRQLVAAKDQSAGDDVHIVNHYVTPYLDSVNLYADITKDSTNVTIGLNKFFNLVIWGVANKSGEYSPVMCNLPSGFYNGLADCENDVLGYDDFNIPREFNIESSTGFLICRLTFKMTATSWEYQSTVDLRGTTAQTASGGSGAAITSFNDSTFDIHNLLDSTKELNFDISAVTTGNTRVWTVQDKDITVAGIDDVAVVQGDVDGFDDELKSLTAVEIQQLQNIDTTTISSTQWGYLGELDQALKTTDSPTFVDLILTGGDITGANGYTLDLGEEASSYAVFSGNIRIDGTEILKNGADFNIDLNDASQNRTLYIKNSDGTYKADLNVENDVIVGNDVTVNGNMNILGNLTTINVEEVLSKNPFIFTNVGYTGSGVPQGKAGTVIKMGTATDLGLIVNSTTQTARVGELVMDLGDVISATATEIVLDANASAVDDVYNGKVISVYKEGETTEYQTITDYVGASKTATVASWGTQPDNTWQYQVELSDDTLAIAAREDAPTDNGIAFWDSATFKFETDSNFVWDGTSLTIGSTKNLAFVDGGSVNIINSSYVANNTSLMTSLAIATKIEAYGYSTTVGTVTSVTGSAPVVSSGGATPEISMVVATAIADGYLDKDDWTIFNSKQDALTFGIADTNKVQINGADIANGEYARFTATGLESRTIAEIKSDLVLVKADVGLGNVDNLSNANQVVVGTLSSGDVRAVDSIGKVTSKASGDTFYWTTALQRLAKGSDTQVLTLAGGLPTWATLNVGVTEVTGSAPVVSSGGATPDISMVVATSIADGYLDKDDWTIFNGKVSSLADLGVTSTANELNKLDGYTGDYTDLNYARDLKDTGVTATEYNRICDGILATAAEVNDACDGATAKNSHTHPMHLSPMQMWGAAGFIFTERYSHTAVYSVLMTDTNADLYANFSIPETGSYTLHIIVARSDGANSIAGNIYASNSTAGYTSSNLASIEWRLSLPSANVLYDIPWTSSWNLTAGNIVRTHWNKKDSEGSGYMYCLGMYLKKA